MRLFLMVLLLLFQHSTQTDHTQDRSRHADRGVADSVQVAPTGKSIGSSDKESPASQTDKKDDYDPSQDRLYRWYLRATVIGVIGGFVGIGVLVWQAVLTRTSANAARDAADAALLNARSITNTERAWILVTFIADGDIPRNATIYCRITNHGRTPAEISRCSVIYFPHAYSEDFPEEPEYQQTELAYPKHLIPGEAWAVPDSPFLLATEIPEEMWDSMRDKKQRLVFLGHVVYQDLISRANHETRFCFFLSPNPGVGLIKTGPRHYNRHT